MVTFVTDGLQDIAAVIVRSARIGNAAQTLYKVRDGIFGANVWNAEASLAEAERFEQARAMVAKVWNNN